MQRRTGHPIFPGCSAVATLTQRGSDNWYCCSYINLFNLGNDDFGHLVQTTPNFSLTCGTFMIVATPSVVDWEEVEDRDFWDQ